MNRDSQKHHRHSLRLKEYDYSQSGYYFITICTVNKENIFGEIVNGKMLLNKFGIIVNEIWNSITSHFLNVNTDSFVIMPNHFHGIIIIINDGDLLRRGEVPSPPLKPTAHDIKSPLTKNIKGDETSPLQAFKPTLGQIEAYFKYQTTKEVNNLQNSQGKQLWQRNYYEHVIRNDEDLNQIREYIIYNPLKWNLDEENQNKA